MPDRQTTLDKTKALLALVILLTLGLAAILVTWGGWDAFEPEATTGDSSHSKARAPTAADEGHREQIAKGHSKQRRQVQLRFGCETLRHNVRRVWSHMKLRVRITDAAGIHLAECTRPYEATSMSIPVDVTQMAITADGYKRKVVPTPPTFKPGAKPATVLLEPDALVRVRAQNLPQATGSHYACSAQLTTGVDDQGRPIVGGRVRYQRPTQGASRGAGAVVWEFRIPSGVPATFKVARTGRTSGDRSGFLGLESPMVTLASGEEREITLDLSDCGTLEGRVTGVAAQALEGQVLSLEIRGEARRHGAGSEAGPIRLDAGGHFRIVGLGNQQVSLQLWTQGGESPALQEVGSGRRQWSAQSAGFVVVEPEVSVHGVVPAKGGTILGRPFRVQSGGAPDSDSPLGRRIPLFTRHVLAKAPLFFLVEGIGHFQHNLAGKLPGADGLYRVEVPAPGGSLRVLVENQPKKGVYLIAEPVGSGSGGIDGTAAEPPGDNWRFDGLPPGDYRLLVTYDARNKRGRYVHAGRILTSTVAVRSQQETKVTVQMPELLTIPGHVTNWPDTKTSVAPTRLRLRHGGQPHTARIDRHGHFQFTVLGPWDGARELTFYGPPLLAEVKTRDVTWVPDRKQLLVAFPGIRKRWLSALPIAGGRLWAHLYPVGARRGQLVHASNNRILIQELPGGVEGILCEQVRRSGRQLRLVRGWFQVASGGAEENRLPFHGRFVQVTMANADQSATLTLKPPPWWQRPPGTWAALRLTGTEPQQLWLPADAAAVVVNGKREIPAQKIGDKLVID